MENITIGHIVSVIGMLTVIVSFFVAIFRWYKSHIIDEFSSIKKRLKTLEKKEEEYEREVSNSKQERTILLRGELAALKGLKEMGCNDAVTTSINEIEKYIIEKSHD